MIPIAVRIQNLKLKAREQEAGKLEERDVKAQIAIRARTPPTTQGRQDSSLRFDGTGMHADLTDGRAIRPSLTAARRRSSWSSAKSSDQLVVLRFPCAFCSCFLFLCGR